MTTTFRDTQGRSWNLAVTISAAKRVRDACGVHLLNIIDKPETLNELATDPITFVDVLYVLCKPQADAAGVTDDQFGESLGGDTIEQATSAFLEALIAFFPRARRQVLRKIVDRATVQMAKSSQELTDLLDSGQLDAQIDEAIASATSSTKSTESPAPPVSIQAR